MRKDWLINKGNTYFWSNPYMHLYFFQANGDRSIEVPRQKISGALVTETSVVNGV